jgi:hypothetical protein
MQRTYTVHFCPKCGSKLRLEKVQHKSRWHYEIYACDKCRLSWDVFINSPRGILRIEECPLYDLERPVI